MTGTLLAVTLGLVPADAGPAHRPASPTREATSAMSLDFNAIEVALDTEKMARAGVSNWAVMRALLKVSELRRPLRLSELGALPVKDGAGTIHRLRDLATIKLKVRDRPLRFGKSTPARVTAG